MRLECVHEDLLQNQSRRACPELVERGRLYRTLGSLKGTAFRPYILLCNESGFSRWGLRSSQNRHFPQPLKAVEEGHCSISLFVRVHWLDDETVQG